MYLLQRKQHTGQRRVERGREPCACAAGQQIPFFRLVPPEALGNSLAHRGAQLDGRTFPAQRQARAEGGRAAGYLSQYDPPPGDVEQAQDLPLHLGNPAALDHGLALCQKTDQNARKGQSAKQQDHGPQMLSDLSLIHISEPTRP